MPPRRARQAVPITIPDNGKQVYFAQLLAQIRSTGLHEAVGRAVREIPATVLRAEIVAHAPNDGLAALQGTGVRDEEVFATPSALSIAPGILAYYRLLLGVSQKQFYKPVTGLSIFQAMEERQEITDAVAPRIPELCTALNSAITRLLRALPAESLSVDIRQLPLLTLGAQADGSWRNQIGDKATRQVFSALKEIVRNSQQQAEESPSSITITNNSGREVTLVLAPDPDVVIREDFGGQTLYKAAIEIKGGTDGANIHNRVGEAEKSHQKARQDGAQDCWTVIHLKHADMEKLGQESPTTREWIDMAHVLARAGDSWDRLVRITKAAMGI